MGQQACVSVFFPDTAAGADLDVDIPWPFKGSWRLISQGYSPSQDDVADATNHAILTIETFDVVGNLAACGGTITNATVQFLIGTARTADLTGAAAYISDGDTVRIAKTDGGTGGIVDGVVTITAEKVPQ